MKYKYLKYDIYIFNTNFMNIPNFRGAHLIKGGVSNGFGKITNTWFSEEFCKDDATSHVGVSPIKGG